MAASLAFCLGKINPLNPSSLAFMAIGKAPRMGCKLPSRDSSPIIIYSESGWFSLICPVDTNIPIAKVRSYAEPSFRRSAGAILSVIFFPGILNPLFCRAAAIR